MKPILTEEKSVVVEVAFNSLRKTGEWANLEEQIAKTNNPIIAAWKIGFYHAMCAYGAGAIREVGQNKGQN